MGTQNANASARQDANAATRSGKEVDDHLLDHDYDGIQEYDNPLPRWWVMLFYGSIVFAVFYVPWYHFGPGKLALEELQAEVTEATGKAQAATAAATGSEPGAAPAPDPYAALIGDAGRIDKGKGIFAARCAACHGPDGGGLVGPNLTDRHWKKGGAMKDIVRVITRGVPGSAMVAWNQQLSEDEIVDVALFIKSLKGTSPANPKAPEGIESNE